MSEDAWTDSNGNPLGAWTDMDSADFWAFIEAEGENLVVFSSLTDPGGVYGPPQIYTAWGFRDEDAPRVDIRDYKDERGRTIRQVCRRFALLENGGQE